MSDEQQSQTSTTAVQAPPTSACPHPEAVGKRWGDPISEERQTKLKGLADQQREWAAKPKAERGESIFAGVRLTGADVFWLAEASGRDQHGHMPNLHLEGADLTEAHLERAHLAEAHLEGADLIEAHLEGANLAVVHLEGANLALAHIEGATLEAAHLERAHLADAHLEGAYLANAHLEHAWLDEAHLEGARLGSSHLEEAHLWNVDLAGVDLGNAHLEGANMYQASLEGKRVPTEEVQRLRQWQPNWRRPFPEVLLPADLRATFLSPGTYLEKVTLGNAEFGFVRVADTRWGAVNLALVAWAQQGRKSGAVILGDESQARQTKDDDGELKDAATWLEDFEAAVRANRQLATVLRDQGLNERADHFAYRAQVLERNVFRRRRQLGRWAFSWLLAVLSGYGYKLQRILIAYILTICAFALVYLVVGVPGGFPSGTVPLVDVFQVSFTAIHGRVSVEQLGLGSTLAWVSALESVIGIVIEAVFTSMLVQRFFAR